MVTRGFLAATVAAVSAAHFAVANKTTVGDDRVTTILVEQTTTVCTCAATSTYSNPWNTVTQPFTWPGKPSAANETPAPRPNPGPYPSGGAAGWMYQGPGWIPKGSDSMTPGMPQNWTNGNSNWGTPDCPVLSLIPSVSTPSMSIPTLSETRSRSTGSASSTKGSGSMTTPATTGTAVSSKSGLPSLSIPPISINASVSVNATMPSIVPVNTASACGKMPDTGVTRSYDFRVAEATIAPDGVQKNGITINGGFPGPLIEANYGDWIEVQVTNELASEGTTFHMHGFFQNETPYMDGVPAVSMCPIVPKDTFTFLFRADHFGTSWYHSHYSAQYSAGAFGPIVIHGPKTEEYDIDVGPVILSDWYHTDYYPLVELTMAGTIFLSNNNLINGKMNYPCANTTLPCTPNAGVSTFNFQSGKKHRIRLINTSADAVQKFSIDNHNMTVIANDFVPVMPYTTNVVTLGIGQRADVIVEAIGKSTDAVWMRSEVGRDPAASCSFYDGVSPVAVASVYYEDADKTTIPTTNSSVTDAQMSYCGNDALDITQPLCPKTLDPTPAAEQIDITFGSNGTNFVWGMNNASYHGNYNQPVLINTHDGNDTYEPLWNAHNFYSNTSVRLIIRNYFVQGPHPMHMHGHDFSVLAEGYGEWDGHIVQESNTIRRDTQLVKPAQDANTPAYIVIQFTQDNPGVWPLHCHVAWHVSGGLFVQIVERPDDIKAMKFPDVVGENCKKWDDYTSTGGYVPDQIDSGL